MGGVIHMDDGYTQVSQNISFGLNVVMGPQLVGNNEGGCRVPQNDREIWTDTFCMKNL